MVDRTDNELVRLARAGDKDAFGELAQRYQTMAQRIAMHIVADEEIAKELAQEAMLQAYLSLEGLRDDTRFKNWLYGIALNICKSYLRDQKGTTFSLESMAGGLQIDAVLYSSAPTLQEIAEEHELHGLVLDAVSSLMPKDKEATLLFYYKQLTLQEIAMILGISVGAVKARLHDARQQLRKQLLSIYSEKTETIHSKQRRKTMVKVTIADVVKREQKDSQLVLHVVMLYDEIGRRAMPIWVGRFECESIALGLSPSATPRPMTYAFIANLLKAANVEVEEVRIETLKEDTFYAVVKIRCGETVREVDARPSDAIALALRAASPIYASEEVLQRAGQSIPQEFKPTQLQKSAESIVKEIEESQRATQTETRPPRTPEQVERASQELIAQVFGGKM